MALWGAPMQVLRRQHQLRRALGVGLAALAFPLDLSHALADATQLRHQPLSLSAPTLVADDVRMYATTLSGLFLCRAIKIARTLFVIPRACYGQALAASFG
jgi:hypothetical protein